MLFLYNNILKVSYGAWPPVVLYICCLFSGFFVLFLDPLSFSPHFAFSFRSLPLFLFFLFAFIPKPTLIVSILPQSAFCRKEIFFVVFEIMLLFL